jgi:hypothetical protein
MGDKAGHGEKPELSSLVFKASDEIAKQQPAPAKPRERSRWITPLAWLVVAVSLGGTGYVLSPWVIGFTEAAIRDGLVVAAQVARTEVEDYRRTNGSLPDALPSVALASVVAYSRDGSGYRLRATEGALFIEMDDKGVVTRTGKS